MLSRYTARVALQTASQRRDIALGASFQQRAAEAGVKTAENAAADMDFANARPFEEIPGPSLYEFVRGAMPGGAFHNKSIFDTINNFSVKYGPLIRLPGLFGTPATYTSLNPDDYPIIFRNEGKWPYRRNFDSVAYYRDVYRKDLFQGVTGIITTSGEKWGEMRHAVNPILLQPKNARLYLDTMLQVNDEFLARIREVRDPVSQEMPADFEEDINRLTFESVAAVALNTQLGLIRKNRDSAEATFLVSSLRKVFDLAFELDVLPSIWKYVSTPKFRELISTLDRLTNICLKYINEAMERIEHDPEGKLTSEVGKEKSVLEKLLRVDKKFAIAMALDMLMAGVDTTSSTLTGILICIAKNPDKQKKLFEEVKQILPAKNSTLTEENMRNMPYLRACIKEGMRLYPIIPGTLRRMPHDVVLSGYVVKAGTDVAIGANLLLRDEKYVPRANEFLPERWLRDEKGKQTLTGAITNPFMFQPFGFGVRSCAGKRIVELEMEINLARLVRNFNIEFNYPVENAFKAKFINVPNIPLKFKLEDRSE